MQHTVQLALQHTHNGQCNTHATSIHATSIHATCIRQACNIYMQHGIAALAAEHCGMGCSVPTKLLYSYGLYSVPTKLLYSYGLYSVPTKLMSQRDGPIQFLQMGKHRQLCLLVVGEDCTPTGFRSLPPLVANPLWPPFGPVALAIHSPPTP